MQQVWHVGGDGQPIMMMRTHLRGSQGLSAWRAWKLKSRDPKGHQIDVRLLVCIYGSYAIIQPPFKQWFSFCVTQLHVMAFPITGRLEWNRFPAPQLGLTSLVHPYTYISEPCWHSTSMCALTNFTSLDIKGDISIPHLLIKWRFRDAVGPSMGAIRCKPGRCAG